MNVVVCGTKDVTPREVVFRAIEESGFALTAIGSPGTAGASQAGISYGKEKRLPTYNGHPPSGLSWDQWTQAIVLVGENPLESRKILEDAAVKGLPIYQRIAWED